MLYCSHLKILVAHEDSTLYLHPLVFSAAKESYLCISALLCTALTLNTHLTLPCLPDTTQSHSSSPPCSMRDVCAYPEFVNIPLLRADHVMIEGGRMPSLLLTLTFLPKVPCLQVAFSPIYVPPRPPASLLQIIPGQPASLTAQYLPGVWGPAHATLGRLWTSSGRD